jgi:hypothetical protein
MLAGAERTYLERLRDHLKHALAAARCTHPTSAFRLATMHPHMTQHEDAPEAYARHAHAVVEGKLRDDHGGVSIEK